MIADSERREVARKLREINPYRNQSYTVPYHRCTPAAEYLAGLAGALGYSPKNDVSRLEFQNRLADLIDPTCEAHRDVLFYPATGLTGECEETVFMCGKCGEIVSYDDGYDPETDLPTYCMRCGSRITGIGEPWDE